MEQYIEQFIEIANGTKLMVIVALIAANFLAGIVASIYTRAFQLRKVGDFLLTRVLPYIFGYFAIVIVAMIQPTWQTWIPIVWGIIVASLSGAILANLKHLGLNLPDSLAGDKK